LKAEQPPGHWLEKFTMVEVGVALVVIVLTLIVVVGRALYLGAK